MFSTFMSMISLVFVILFSFIFCSSWSGMMSALCLVSILSIFSMNGSFSMSVDMAFSWSSISCLMVMLSCVLCYLSLMCSWEFSESSSFSFNIMMLCAVLVMAFCSSSLLGFYIFFEVSLIPTLLLIIGWGYQPERLQAGSYMMMYTVSASLPLLVLVLYFMEKSGTGEICLMNNCVEPVSGGLLFVVLGAFLVKLPMYGAHLWLPKAHVEAPLAGSMILAGVLLKLGGFGIYQMKYSLNLLLDNSGMFLVCLSLWGGLLASLMCLRQMDVKSFVAYSSVAHMSIVIAGLLLDSSWGIFSSLVTMMAHGFSSSAMFCLAYYSYKKSLTRNIPYMKGLLQIAPVLSLWWFIFCCINMACPPTLNLLGELSVVPVMWSSGVSLAIVMGLMVFFSAGYNMYLYSSINHGSFLGYLYPSEGMKSSSILSMVAHFIPLALILKSSIFLFI